MLLLYCRANCIIRLQLSVTQEPQRQLLPPLYSKLLFLHQILQTFLVMASIESLSTELLQSIFEYVSRHHFRTFNQLYYENDSDTNTDFRHFSKNNHFSYENK